MIFSLKKQVNKKRITILILILTASVLTLSVVWWKKEKAIKLVPMTDYQISQNADNQQSTNNAQEKQWPLGTLRNPLYDPNVTMTSEGNKHYRNEEYGFEFDFPADWIIKEPAFGNTANVLFNFEILPPGSKKLPNPVLVSVLQKERIDKLMKEREDRGDEMEDIQIGAVQGKRYVLLSEGLPHITNAFQCNNYWIMIGAKIQYEDTLNKIIKTVKFTENGSVQ